MQHAKRAEKKYIVNKASATHGNVQRLTSTNITQPPTPRLQRPPPHSPGAPLRPDPRWRVGATAPVPPRAELRATSELRLRSLELPPLACRRQHERQQLANGNGNASATSDMAGRAPGPAQPRECCANHRATRLSQAVPCVYARMRHVPPPHNAHICRRRSSPGPLIWRHPQRPSTQLLAVDLVNHGRGQLLGAHQDTREPPRPLRSTMRRGVCPPTPRRP